MEDLMERNYTMAFRNYVVMTVKGNQKLTKDCLKSLAKTIDADQIEELIVVDAGFGEERFNERDESLNIPKIPTVQCMHRANVGISEGWNIGIEHIAVKADRTKSFVWLLNNDVIFNHKGWIEALSGRLSVAGCGIVGSTTASVFGHGFASGGIWGFRLDTALKVAENGKVLDERMNYAFQDVDLSVRLAKEGYEVTHALGVELGADPMMTHLGSQTTGLSEKSQQLRKEEERIFLEKHGRRE